MKPAKAKYMRNCPLDLRKVSKEELTTFKTNLGPSAPFDDLKIKEVSYLNNLKERSNCKKCKKSRMYFCYTCYLPVEELEDYIPKLTLPCSVDIIKHPKEIDGKSTAIHAAVIAPENVRIFTYPDIPNYNKEAENVFLIFPNENSLTLEDVANCKPPSSFCVEKSDCNNSISKSNPSYRAIFIDSTWNQTKRLINDERLRGLTCITLTKHETLFWRYQKGKPKTYLATIEAIYYFLNDFHAKILKLDYQGEYDNLLFFFKFMYDKIHKLYNSDDLLAYKDIKSSDI